MSSEPSGRAGTDTLDGGAGDDMLDPDELEFESVDFSGHVLGVQLDETRIADDVFDDRNVVLTLTGPGGLSISYLRNLPLTASVTTDTGNYVTFPIDDAFTEYTLTITVSAGLTGDATYQFNSSDLTYDENEVCNLPPYLILSTGYNYGPNGEPPYEGYEPPDSEQPVLSATNDYGGIDGPYVTYAGGTFTADAANGVMAADLDFEGTDPASRGATVELVAQPLHGTVTLNSDGSFSYTASANYVGQDFYRYVMHQGDDVSLPATVYVAIDNLVMEAKARGSWDDMWRMIGQSVQGTGAVFVTPPAWVGEAIDLRVRGTGIVPFQFGGTQYEWKVSDMAVGGWTADENGSHETPATAERNEPTPTIYWVDGGVKRIDVTVTRPLRGIGTVSGNIAIKKPNAGASATSETVHIRQGGPNNNWFVELGTEPNPNAPQPTRAGMVFSMVKDPNAPAGQYDWIQRINYKLTHTDSANKKWTAASPGFVYDVPIFDDPNRAKFPWPKDAKSEQTKDSPNNAIGYDIQGAVEPWIGSSRNDSFEMYLMWNPFPNNGGIMVPLRRIDWQFKYVAAPGGGGFVLTSSFPALNTLFPSQDTIQYPSWSENVQRYLNTYLQEP